MATIIQSFEAKELKKRPFVIKMADKLTSFFGSVWFLCFNVALFTFWIAANMNLIPGISPFDEFPFFFLTTGVSLEAIILTITVLISQQRQNQVSTIREEIDMQINRISEKEITKALFILKKIAEKQGVKIEDNDLDEMLKDLEVSYIERKLAQQLEEKHHSSPIIKDVENVAEKLEQRLKTK